MTRELARLGARLRERGLCQRALLHCLGLRFPLPGRLPALRGDVVTPPVAAVPALLFAGRERIAEDAARRSLGDDLDALAALGLIELGAGAARAPAAVLPVGDSLAICPWDRLPDDSSLHLVGALPAAPVARWLDVGTGSAFAPLARPDLAGEILASDIDAELLDLAQLALPLSGHDHVATIEADLCAAGTAQPGWSLITFNAPLCDDLPALLDRFWSQAAHLVAGDGEVIVHSRWLGPPPVAEAGGALSVCRYGDVSDRFAITAWRPGDPAGRRDGTIELGGDRPHIRRSDLW